MRLSFEWDEEKAGENYRKHKVSFDEGITVFNDPFSLTIGDPDHSADEQRYVDIGASDRGRVGGELRGPRQTYTPHQLPQGNTAGTETI